MDKPIIFYEVRPQVNRSRTRIEHEVQCGHRAHRPERRHAHFRAEGRYGHPTTSADKQPPKFGIILSNTITAK